MGRFVASGRNAGSGGIAPLQNASPKVGFGKAESCGKFRRKTVKKFRQVHLRKKVSRPFHGLARGHAAQHGKAEGKAVLRVGAQILHGFGAEGMQHAVDVVVVREKDDAAREPSGEQHFAGAEGGLAARVVAVEHELEVGAEAGEPLYLFRGERRAEHAHGLRVAVLVQGDDVHVPFGENDALLHRDGGPCLKQAEQMFALLVDGRIAAVDVLGVVLLRKRRNDASAEGDGLSRQVADGEHEPVAEAVEGASALAFGLKSAFHGRAQGKARAAQRVAEILPRIHAPAEAELFHEFRGNAPLAYVVAAHGGALRGEIAVEVRGGKLMHLLHVALLGALFLRPGIGAVGLETYARLLGERGEGFFEVEAVHAAVEVEDVAGGLTAEAVEGSLLLVDGERRLGFLMERAGRDETGACGTQLHVTPRHVGKTDARLYRLYHIVVLHDDLPSLAEQNLSHAVAALIFGSGMVGSHAREGAQKFMHGPAQRAGAAAVNDFHAFHAGKQGAVEELFELR